MNDDYERNAVPGEGSRRAQFAENAVNGTVHVAVNVKAPAGTSVVASATGRGVSTSAHIHQTLPGSSI